MHLKRKLCSKRVRTEPMSLEPDRFKCVRCLKTRSIIKSTMNSSDAPHRGGFREVGSGAKVGIVENKSRRGSTERSAASDAP